MKKIAFTLIILIIGLSSFKKDDNKTMPSIKLKDLTGKQVDLKDLVGNGKITIVDFWATWCSPCKKEIENMTDYLDDWKKDYDVQLIAVSIDDARNSMKVKPYIQGKKWDFTVLLDENQDSQRAFDFVNVPYTIVIDKNGNIVYKHSGYTDGDELVLQQKLAEISKQ